MPGIAIQPKYGFGASQPNKPNSSVFGAYGGAVNQAGEDYDSLMANYRGLLGSGGGSPVTSRPIQAQTTPYSSSPDVASALTSLRGLSENGGYSDADQANIRERGISPIRSVYANAMQNLQRNKTLQGGYSPGYSAALAKMTRDLSDSISSQVGNVNADLAGRIASGRMQGANAYFGAAEGQNNDRNRINESNTNNVNRVNEFNSNRDLEVQNTNNNLNERELARKSGIVNDMRGLYGTTPALASTFGDQALRSAGLSEQQRQFNTSMRNRNRINPAMMGAS